jgi:hypothetical protein
MQWMNEIIEDRDFLLTDKESNCIGPYSELRNCRLELRTNWRALTITASKLVSCHIHAKKKLAQFNWCRSFLDTCTFVGHYYGCEFGHLPEVYWEHGGIDHCDFSEARLEGCRFTNCQMASLKLPAWPCFTVLNPARRAAKIKALDWPGKLKTVWAVCLADEPEWAVGVSDYAPHLIEKYGGSEEEFKQLLVKLGDVVM